MQIPREFRILYFIIGAFVTGLLVLIFKPDYRVEYNLESNSGYYANLKVHTDSQKRPVPSSDIEAESPSLSRDIEF